MRPIRAAIRPGIETDEEAKSARGSPQLKRLVADNYRLQDSTDCFNETSRISRAAHLSAFRVASLLSRSRSPSFSGSGHSFSPSSSSPVRAMINTATGEPLVYCFPAAATYGPPFFPFPYRMHTSSSFSRENAQKPAATDFLLSVTRFRHRPAYCRLSSGANFATDGFFRVREI